MVVCSFQVHQTHKAVHHFVTIEHKNSDFGDLGIAQATSIGFYIVDGVHGFKYSKYSFGKEYLFGDAVRLSVNHVRLIGLTDRK